MEPVKMPARRLRAGSCKDGRVKSPHERPDLSRLIPLIPVWEVQEGQMTHTLRKVGKAHVPTVSEFE